MSRTFVTAVVLPIYADGRCKLAAKCSQDYKGNFKDTLTNRDDQTSSSFSPLSIRDQLTLALD